MDEFMKMSETIGSNFIEDYLLPYQRMNRKYHQESLKMSAQMEILLENWSVRRTKAIGGKVFAENCFLPFAVNHSHVSIFVG